MLIQDSRTPAVGEALLLKQELEYCKDNHTVAVLKKFGALHIGASRAEVNQAGNYRLESFHASSAFMDLKFYVEIKKELVDSISAEGLL